MQRWRLNGFRISVVISDDGGATWTAPVPITGDHDDTQEQFASPGVGPDGTVYIAYEKVSGTPSIDNPCAPAFAGMAISAQVWVAKSTDGGATWTQHFVGVTRVAFVSTLPGGAYNTMIRESRDGATWSDAVSLGVMSCACYGYNSPERLNLGHYLGLDARDGVVVITFPQQPSLGVPINIWAMTARYEE